MLKDWNEYQELSKSTAIYPNVGDNLSYPILGLIDETGEFMEKQGSGASQEDLRAELGDIYWYVAAVCRELGYNMEDVANASCASVDILVLLKMAGIAKKVQRDGPEVIEEKDMFGKLACFWVQLRNSLGLSKVQQLQVAQENLDKLNSRKERGKLQGSGDNR